MGEWLVRAVAMSSGMMMRNMAGSGWGRPNGVGARSWRAEERVSRFCDVFTGDGWAGSVEGTSTVVVGQLSHGYARTTPLGRSRQAISHHMPAAALCGDEMYHRSAVVFHEQDTIQDAY